MVDRRIESRGRGTAGQEWKIRSRESVNDLAYGGFRRTEMNKTFVEVSP